LPGHGQMGSAYSRGPRSTHSAFRVRKVRSKRARDAGPVHLRDERRNHTLDRLDKRQGSQLQTEAIAVVLLEGHLVLQKLIEDGQGGKVSRSARFRRSGKTSGAREKRGVEILLHTIKEHRES